MPIDRNDFEDLPTYNEVAESIGEYLAANPDQAYTPDELIDTLSDDEKHLAHDVLQTWKDDSLTANSGLPVEYRMDDDGTEYYAVDPEAL